MERIEGLLRRCVEVGGSDLHFKTDTGQVYCRIMGDLVHFDDVPQFSSDEFREELNEMLRPEQLLRFDQEWELDFAHEVKGVSRFRGNLYIQRLHVQAAFRVIPYHISSMEDLQLPPACFDFIERPRGLVLVTGPAGSGKSTTLAAMIDRINKSTTNHIITVEDPVEFVHDDHKALINQRELEQDTLTFANALKHVLRQDPDVILIGEMRDLETIHLAITAAETGHLVFATLHTVDAVQTVDRIIDVFPIHQQQQVRMQLSVNLVGVVSQTLVKRKDNRGRIAAYEILNATPAVRNLIRENKSYQIGSIIQTGMKQKMITLDQALCNLVGNGLVNFEDARMKAKDPGEFARLVQLTGAGQAAQPAQAGAPGPIPPGPPPQMSGQAPPMAPPPGTGGAPPAQNPQQGGVRGQPNRPGFRKD
ncbi:MAG TPA: type IV pilus twitching motility protein PilT [Fimbriimonadaceae bacterium]|nr:type IV pilus twitching motility protein PilT [Fimbriimonadaceae bacterium]HRJ32782.1 type IV pilus twitching motility protein PilT [Fimbriimonadaceae bacterium]